MLPKLENAGAWSGHLREIWMPPTTPRPFNHDGSVRYPREHALIVSPPKWLLALNQYRGPPNFQDWQDLLSAAPVTGLTKK